MRKRLCEILGDRGGGLSLRGGQRVGQGIDDLPAQMTVARVADARGTAKLRPHQRQRQLSGKQLVEGEPLPERFVGKDVVELLRNVDAFQRFVERGKFRPPDHVRADPFGQVRQFRQRERDRPPQ